MPVRIPGRCASGEVPVLLSIDAIKASYHTELSASHWRPCSAESFKLLSGGGVGCAPDIVGVRSSSAREVNFHPAGQARGAGCCAIFRTATRTRTQVVHRQCEADPSFHPEVPDSAMACSPGRGLAVSGNQWAGGHGVRYRMVGDLGTEG